MEATVALIPEGTNSHTFEPPPSPAELLSTADVVFMNGLDLEDPTEQFRVEGLAVSSDGAACGPRTVVLRS